MRQRPLLSGLDGHARADGELPVAGAGPAGRRHRTTSPTTRARRTRPTSTALAASGITGGCAANRFCPSSGVARAQMASFLVRARAYQGVRWRRRAPITSTTMTGIIHENNINRARRVRDHRWLCGPGSTARSTSVTRGQMAAFLKRAFATDPPTRRADAAAARPPRPRGGVRRGPASRVVGARRHDASSGSGRDRAGSRPCRWRRWVTSASRWSTVAGCCASRR